MKITPEQKAAIAACAYRIQNLTYMEYATFDMHLDSSANGTGFILAANVRHNDGANPYEYLAEVALNVRFDSVGKMKVSLDGQLGGNFEILNDGWYTLGISFYENASGKLAAKAFIYDENGQEVVTWDNFGVLQAGTQRADLDASIVTRAGSLMFAHFDDPTIAVLIKDITVSIGK